MIRLAVVLSHPIQYYAPWFRQLAQQQGLLLQVFYLWDFGVSPQLDRGFGQELQWDVPLLEGYTHTFVANCSSEPGTHHFAGLHNPSLAGELLRWRPDAVLLFGYAYRSHLGLLLDPRLWHVPLLLRGDSHQLAPRAGLKPLLALLLRRLLFRRFAAGLPVGQANAAWMARNGIRRLFLAPHAVDNARFQAAAPEAERAARAWRQQLGIPAAAPVVLFAGKFEAKKRPLDLLEAFAALHHPTAVLVFVGAGPLEAELKRRATFLGLGQVIFQGFQNQTAMPRTYALADLVVLPSYGPGETWGLCINEAMNLAKTVIVSSHVGCGPDLVIPGQTGWIFPSGDRMALTAALEVAFSDPDLLLQMGMASRKHIDSYSYHQATAGLMQALTLLQR
ncbi:glycosyltransferase family 4 protein [Cyanobium sp. Maggiore-St4-Cus]|uniref:glycosyltransferase family 4 protein n=1 Tax=Cyanobium sp. Maggiore-St4-Cus TaxID=2823717 RepID=UPI0020CBE75C|nr:glycosyltransferase family 4 protein [Cyanobium sp. Maggiore-St4-Cus]MCP9787689.1 glycosyltransferase family 4 protein [Cyanobium sp. Maggiore-St4-Cus]